MSLFAAIESSFQTQRLAGKLDRALRHWRGCHDPLARFTDVGDLIACLNSYRDADAVPEPVGDAVLGALCTEARRRSNKDSSEISAPQLVDNEVAHPGEAASLILWLFLPQLWGSQYTNPGRALDQEDLEAEMALGLWEAVVEVTATTTGVGPRLVNAARKRARSAARGTLEYERRRRNLALVAGAAASPPSGYPWQAVSDALRSRVISRIEARLIARTRIQGRSLAEVAASLGLSTEAALLRRKRGETRLLAWLAGKPMPPRRDANGRERHAEALQRREIQDVEVATGLKPQSIVAWGGRKEVMHLFPPVSTSASHSHQEKGNRCQRT